MDNTKLWNELKELARTDPFAQNLIQCIELGIDKERMLLETLILTLNMRQLCVDQLIDIHKHGLPPIKIASQIKMYCHWKLYSKDCYEVGCKKDFIQNIDRQMKHCEYCGNEIIWS